MLTILTTLINGLKQLGNEVKVLTPANRRKSFQKGDDYVIHSVPALYYPEERLALIRWDPLLDDRISWKPDIVHLHTEGRISRLANKTVAKSKVPGVVTRYTGIVKSIWSFALAVFMIGFRSGVFESHSEVSHVKAIIMLTEKSRRFSRLRDLDRAIYPQWHQSGFLRPVSEQEKHIAAAVWPRG